MTSPDSSRAVARAAFSVCSTSACRSTRSSGNEPSCASIRARLKQHTDTSKQDFNLTLTRYGLERLLYRLSISEHAPNFLLKGALLFQLWYGQPHRPTRDADLLGFGPDDIEVQVSELLVATADQSDAELDQSIGEVLKLDDAAREPNPINLDPRLARVSAGIHRLEGQLLMVVDVDCFKQFNDAYGHQVGDECLKAVARALAGNTRRPVDLVARIQRGFKATQQVRGAFCAHGFGQHVLHEGVGIKRYLRIIFSDFFKLAQHLQNQIAT